MPAMIGIKDIDMGRNPKIRASYDNDAQFLLRLKRAVEEDGSRPIAWRSEIMTMLQELIEAFIQAPNPEKKVNGEVA
jgi:hypothetical protein